MLALPGACQTTGSGMSNVTCESVAFVWLSQKDTKLTQRQVAENNAAWISICGSPPPNPYRKKR